MARNGAIRRPRSATASADLSGDNRLLVVQCLANFGYSGSPILADIDGIPAVVGIFSAFQEESRGMFARLRQPV